MQVRIYRPARSAMQSGKGNTKRWLVEFEPQAPKQIDPLMGWISSRDTRSQVRLRFETKEDAIAYCTREGLAYKLFDEQPRRPLRPKSYADNFRFDRIA